VAEDVADVAEDVADVAEDGWWRRKRQR